MNMKKVYFLISFCLLLIVSQTIIAQVIKGNYAIKNVQTGMLLRIKDANSQNGTPLVVYYPENWKCMTWNFIHVEGTVYKLENLLTLKTFQPIKNGSTNTELEEQPLDPGSLNQQYEFESVDKDNYRIKLKGTELYITPAEEKGTVNSKIVLAKRMNVKYQLWSIYNQSPTM